MASNHFDDELKPDAEANRIISDSDLINIDIKELNKMLKERGIAKVLQLQEQKQYILIFLSIASINIDYQYNISTVNHFTHWYMLGTFCQTEAKKKNIEE